MYKYILQNAEGDINWMALFALLTFFTLFVISIVMIFGKNKGYIDKMSRMPLDDNLSTSTENE